MISTLPHYGFLSILPPIIAIVLALVTRHVVLSLFAGIWLGATFIYDMNPVIGFLHIIDRFIQPAIADSDHVAIIIFSMLLGGMVGVISKNGGTLGIVSLITRWAKTPRSGQLATWMMGLVIFFDDYANTLIVGHTMRPITDKLKVSREKLAFIVDSTAAPVAGLTLSTWIGYEIGLIQDALQSISYSGKAFSVFLFSIPYSFYPILTIFFVFMITWTRRDFGPMRKAENRSLTTGKLVADNAHPAEDQADLNRVLPKNGIPHRWINAVLPISVVIVVTLVGLYVTGKAAIIESGEEIRGLRHIISNSSSYQALFWASLSGCVVAILLSVSQQILSITEAMEAWFNGLKSMLLAMVILTLAWSIGAVTKEMGTAVYLTQILKDAVNPAWIPTLTFILAAATSFATGTSWGTMAILVPLVLPLSWTIASASGLPPTHVEAIFLATTSSVLAGAIFGDHCSPISDTTVMSSMASACDHVDHVRTQIPYAALVAMVCIIMGYIPAGFGLSPFLSIAIGAVTLLILLRLLGKKKNV